jgi:hypothetical protein
MLTNIDLLLSLLYVRTFIKNILVCCNPTQPIKIGAIQEFKKKCFIGTFIGDKSELFYAPIIKMYPCPCVTHLVIAQQLKFPLTKSFEVRDHKRRASLISDFHVCLFWTYAPVCFSRKQWYQWTHSSILSCLPSKFGLHQNKVFLMIARNENCYILYDPCLTYTPCLSLSLSLID